MSENISIQEKVHAIYSLGKFRPVFTVGIILLSMFAGLLEGIGLSFILPIVEVVRSGASEQNTILTTFRQVYEFFGVPFILETIILGVALVLTTRYVASFVVSWLSVKLQKEYVYNLRRELYQKALSAKVGYFDKKGSDELLNAVITQSGYTETLISQFVQLLQISFISVVYLSIAMYIAPLMTVVAIVILGISTYVIRWVFESGFSVGDQVAETNENIQEVVQSGTQGIRDVKLFTMTPELFSEFEESMEEWVEASVKEGRNSAGVANFHQLSSALAVFLLVYLAVDYASLSIATLSLFLFAIFRLAPKASGLNNKIYRIESRLPHLVRGQEFVEQLEQQQEKSGGRPAPDHVDRVTFDGVTFSYDGLESILRDISFEVEENEFIAFVGPSGAGKSTIMSLLARMYEPDEGEIRANNIPISELDIESWRERIAVVRQSPFIFNETLRYNVTIGNREATQEEIERVCEIAKVDEFFEELSDGYDTLLGDDGVRLSGGQKQRVALARALLKDADILVLDEATSDLDKSIESDVQAAIEQMDQDYINITVAHRLSTVRNADRIYTMVDGEIMDIGRHEELLNRDGKYAELHSTQGGA